MKVLFETYARYNSRINKQFYALAANVTDTELERDCGLYFRSIIGTLNHIAVGDIIWLKRFADEFSDLSSLNFIRSLDQPERLDSILCQSLRDLSHLRSNLDRCIINFIHELNPDHLAARIHYKNVKGEAATKNLGLLLLHFFNHQTHHRGQISAALSQSGLDIGTTDLLLEIPNE